MDITIEVKHINTHTHTGDFMPFPTFHLHTAYYRHGSEVCAWRARLLSLLQLEFVLCFSPCNRPDEWAAFGIRIGLASHGFTRFTGFSEGSSALRRGQAIRVDLTAASGSPRRRHWAGGDRRRSSAADGLVLGLRWVGIDTSLQDLASRAIPTYVQIVKPSEGSRLSELPAMLLKIQEC